VRDTTTTSLLQTSERTQRDSVFIHDSIRVEYRRGNLYHSSDSLNSLFIRSPDTVVVEKWHTRWRDRETVRTDTMQVESIKVETKEVRHVPRFYKYCAALLAFIVLALLLRVALYLYGRFR